jgi:predicted ATP-grasp superfamily ATP-dependent carboligase
MRKLGAWDLNLEQLNGQNGNEGIDLKDYIPRQISRLDINDAMVTFESHEDPIRLLHDHYRAKLNLFLGDAAKFLYVSENNGDSMAKCLLNDEEALRTISNDFKGYILDPFIQHPIIGSIQDRTGLGNVTSYEITDRFNSNLGFINYMREIGVNVPDTRIIRSEEELKSSLQECKYSKAVLKKDRGASGLGMMLGKRNDLLSFFRESDEKDKEDGFLLQEMLDLDCSPSVIYETHSRPEEHRKTLTMQLLEENSSSCIDAPPSVHCGNVCIPGLSLTSMDSTIDSIIKLSIQEGAFGPAGADFMITKDYQIYAAEINQRITGTFQYMELYNKLWLNKLINPDNILWAGMNISRGNASNKDVLDLCKSLDFEGFVFPTNLAAEDKVMVLFIGPDYDDLFENVTNFEGVLSGINNESRNSEYKGQVAKLASDIQQGLLR